MEEKAVKQFGSALVHLRDIGKTYPAYLEDEPVKENLIESKNI